MESINNYFDQLSVAPGQAAPQANQILARDAENAHTVFVNAPTAPVTSVAGRTGAVTLSTSDVSGLGTAATADASDFDAAGAAATAQGNAETYAAGAASTAQTNAESYAASAASTAQDNAETYADEAASAAQAASLQKAQNLADLVSPSTARANLGLGTAATKDAGTSAGNAVILDGSAKLPAVNASQLTNLPASGSIGALQYNAGGVLGGAGWKFVGTAGSERLIGPGVTDDGTSSLQSAGNILIENGSSLIFDSIVALQYSGGVITLIGASTFDFYYTNLKCYGISTQNGWYQPDDHSIVLGAPTATVGTQNDVVVAQDLYLLGQQIGIFSDDAVTTATTIETLHHATSGTPSAGFGSTKVHYLDSSTNTQRPCAGVTAAWADSTDATYAGSYTINVYVSYSDDPIAGLTITADGVAEGYGPRMASAVNTLDDGIGNATFVGVVSMMAGAQAPWLQLTAGSYPSMSPAPGMLIWNDTATAGQEMQIYGGDGAWHYIPYI